MRYHTSNRPDLISAPAGNEAMLVVAHPSTPCWPPGPAGASVGRRTLAQLCTYAKRTGLWRVLAHQLARTGPDRADVDLIDSLTARKRLAQASFGNPYLSGGGGVGGGSEGVLL